MDDRIIRSRTLYNSVCSLDDQIRGMEDYIIELEEERDEWRKKYNSEITKSIENGNIMIAQSLKACIDVPDINGLTPACAVVLTRIREMKTIQEVKKYINKISKGLTKGKK